MKWVWKSRQDLSSHYFFEFDTIPIPRERLQNNHSYSDLLVHGNIRNKTFRLGVVPGPLCEFSTYTRTRNRDEPTKYQGHQCSIDADYAHTLTCDYEGLASSTLAHGEDRETVGRRRGETKRSDRTDGETSWSTRCHLLLLLDSPE